MNWQRMLPTQRGSMGDCVASGNVSPLVVTQSKQITTSEENIKDFKRHFVVLKTDLHI